MPSPGKRHSHQLQITLSCAGGRTGFTTVSGHRRLYLSSFSSHPLTLSSTCENRSDRVFALHGKMVQKKRDGMYARFAECPSGVLLCTDVAARGIDIPDIDWIIQFEPPQVRGKRSTT